MQLLICSGYHSPELTHAFLQSLLRVLTPERLWVLPIGSATETLSVLFSCNPVPQTNQLLHVIGFSAGVVAAYPLVTAWQSMGGTSRLIAMDGWGMPLLGNLSVYRMSHDHWTHRTTYFPTPDESKGYFYADPAVDHLTLWHSPHTIAGKGAIGEIAPCSMTALEFIRAVLLTNNA